MWREYSIQHNGLYLVPVREKNVRSRRGNRVEICVYTHTNTTQVRDSGILDFFSIKIIIEDLCVRVEFFYHAESREHTVGGATEQTAVLIQTFTTKYMSGFLFVPQVFHTRSRVFRKHLSTEINTKGGPR